MAYSSPSLLLLLSLVVVMVTVTPTLVDGLKFAELREFKVAAGSPVGTIVGRLRVEGSGSSNEDLVYLLLNNSTDNAPHYFSLEPKTGLITTARVVDLAINSSYQIIAKATSGRTRSTEPGRFSIRVAAPTRPSDPARLAFDQDQYSGVVETDSAAGTIVIRLLAIVSGPVTAGDVTYFIEHEPSDKLAVINGTEDNLLDWFKVDSRTGVVRLLKEPANSWAVTGGNVTFMVGARDASRSMQARASVAVIIHGLTRPNDLQVTKLSAHAAVICWHFPNGQRRGAHGYKLRYGRPPLDFVSSHGQVLELKIHDDENAPAESAEEEEEQQLRRVCATIKQLDPESAYQLQVSAWRIKNADQELVGPASATLHFTTQTNYCLQNGTCETGECQVSLEPPGFECMCHSGHYGARCEFYNPCVLSPCLNGATCLNQTDGTFHCKCAQGFEGAVCSSVPGCPLPCLNNGSCSLDPLHPGCVCKPGWNGVQCQEIDPCWNNPCPSGSTCAPGFTDNPAEFVCNCPPGFRGRHCEEAIDYCILAPCKNDGHCVSKDEGYHCECREGFQGVDCERDVNECDNFPCREGATCINIFGSFTCTCPPGFTGSRCEYDEDSCLSSPCLNRGVCQDGLNDNYTCFCMPGFDGSNCEIDIDDCIPNPCLNGGTCSDLVDDFECTCLPGYQGNRCQNEDQCPAQVEEKEDYGTFTWPLVAHGKTVALECPHGPTTVNAERTCQISADGTVSWMPSDTTACRKRKSLEEETKLNKTDSWTPIELNDISSKVTQLLDEAVTDPTVAQTMFNSLSNVMEAVDDQLLVESQISVDRILDAVEKFSSQVQLEPGQIATLATPNIAVEAVLLNSSQQKPESSYSFRPAFADVGPVSLTIPGEALASQKGSVRLKFVSYRSGKLFQSRKKILSGEPGLVITASVGDQPVSGLTQPVVYSMPLTKGSSFYTCVYWDEIDKDWSTKGIKTSWSKETNSIKCESDHLTAFSVLLDITPTERLSPFHEQILRIISYVGSGLSIFGLTITVLLYSLFRNLRRDRGGKILLNMCISLLALNVIFLVGSILGSAYEDFDRLQSTQERVWVAGRNETQVSTAQIDFCTSLTVAVHYLVLSSLAWMLVEAIHMYQLLITVFANSETCFMLKRMAGAWGIPLAVVFSTAFLCIDYYQDPTGQTCGRMSLHYPIVYYGSFVGPSCLIVLINSIVFLMVLRVILLQGQRGRAAGKVPTENGPSHQGTGGIKGGFSHLVSMAQLRGAVTVMALLGITWVAGALAIGPAKLIMSYVFCVCNSLQGFIIFIVRVVQYPEARTSWITLWNTGQTHIPYDATRHSTGGPTTNSSGSHSSNNQSRKVKGGSKKSSTGSTSIRTIQPPSLTPSQAPTLAISGDQSMSLSYQHWFPAATAAAHSPASNGSSQSRFRRIFGQLGLEPSSLRLSTKSHSLLERHVSGATNPPPSPGQETKLIHPAASSVLPEELVKPNFIIGEEISLLRRPSSVEPSREGSLHTSSVAPAEGANTSWTFLRPDLEEDFNLPTFQSSKGSSAPILRDSSIKESFSSTKQGSRRANSFALHLPSDPDPVALSQIQYRIQSRKRTLSLGNENA